MILDFLDDAPVKQELLGHKTLVFFKEDCHYYADFALKRALISSAVDDEQKQRVYMCLGTLLIKKYKKWIQFEVLFKFL